MPVRLLLPRALDESVGEVKKPERAHRRVTFAAMVGIVPCSPQAAHSLSGGEEKEEGVEGE